MSPAELPQRLAWCGRVSIEALRLRLSGFQRVARPLMEASAGESEPWPAPDPLNRAVAGTGRLPWSTCLTRSSALARYLRKHGTPAVLRIGVALPGQGLDAHAWVEVDGKPFNEPAESHAQLTPLDAPGS